MTKQTVAIVAVSAVILAVSSAPALAGSHNWRINELFSSADGTIQFVEMKECCGTSAERNIGGKAVSSDATGNEFIFPANLPGSANTANKHLLLATAAFAALPGAPTPDYIIPENLFGLNADTVRYHIYTNSPLIFTEGELPLDGVNSLNDAGSPPNDNTFVAINSPTNFAGETGSVVVVSCPADLDLSGTVDAADLALLLGDWGPCPAPCAGDLDGNLVVNAADLATLLGAWGPCGS